MICRKPNRLARTWSENACPNKPSSRRQLTTMHTVNRFANRNLTGAGWLNHGEITMQPGLSLREALLILQSSNSTPAEHDAALQLIRPIVQQEAWRVRTYWSWKRFSSSWVEDPETIQNDALGVVWLKLRGKKQAAKLPFDPRRHTDDTLLEKAFARWVRELLKNRAVDEYRKNARSKPCDPRLLDHGNWAQTNPNAYQARQDDIEQLRASISALVRVWRPPPKKGNVDYLCILLVEALIRIWELAGMNEKTGIITAIEQLLSRMPELRNRRIGPGFPTLSGMLRALRRCPATLSRSRKDVITYLAEVCGCERLNYDLWRQWLRRAIKKFREYPSRIAEPWRQTLRQILEVLFVRKPGGRSC